MQSMVLTVCILLYAETCLTFSNVKLNINEYYNKPRNDLPVTKQSANNVKISSEDIKTALGLLNTETHDSKSVSLNKCLLIHDRLGDKLNCINNLVNKPKFKRYSDKNNPKYNNHYQYNMKNSNDINSDEFAEINKLNLDKSYQSQNNFSQDYLDVADLLRTNNGVTKDNKSKKRYVFKIVQPHNKYDRFNYDLSRFRKSNPSEKGERSWRSDSNSDYSDSSESGEGDRMKKGSQSDYKTMDKSYDIGSSEEFSSDEEHTMQFQKQKPLPKIMKKAPVFYIQGPSRLYQEDSRRRLPHFFPKRLHWNEDDVKVLKNYWFNGPKGKYWGYRIPY